MLVSLRNDDTRLDETGVVDGSYGREGRVALRLHVLTAHELELEREILASELMVEVEEALIQATILNL